MHDRCDEQMALDIQIDSPSQQRFTPHEPFRDTPTFIVDVPETIPQMGYGSHQFFRYYGKFPSIIGREIVSKFTKPGDHVLDCYAGSGTTLVEAQIAGCPSYGLDINPLGVLASNVKTSYFDIRALIVAYQKLQTRISKGLGADAIFPLSVAEKKIRKWFTDEAIEDLSRIHSALLTLEPSPEREFLVLAFLAIIRRTSNAYDGEIRPHLNISKRPRLPLLAFADKFQDMISGLKGLDRMRRESVSSLSKIGDNRNPNSYQFIRRNSVHLVVAHPPYLNSFNYLAAFSLELMWAEGFPEIWQGWSEKQIKSLENIAWPATNAKIKYDYYSDFFTVMDAVIPCMTHNGILAVIVGDTTIHNKLEPVHQIFWNGLHDRGWMPVETWFRTTHYGVGKYAYRHRANYHGDNTEKRDAIMFFRPSKDLRALCDQ